jgi:glycosyltransferase involved in cell wall biosynthesis
VGAGVEPRANLDRPSPGRRVRVGIVTDGIFPHAVGGIQRHTARLAPELAALGADVEVIAPEGHETSDDRYGVFTLPWPGVRAYPLALRQWAERTSQAVAARDYDVVLGQGLNLWGYLPKGSPPELFHPHGLEMCTVRDRRARAKAYPLRWGARREARQAAAVVSLGGRLGDVLEHSLRVPRERIVTIPNGVDLSEFTPGSPDEATVLWVGRFFANKAPDLMLDVFEQVKTLGARLVLVGDGPMRAALEQRAGSNVTFAGPVSEAELHELYKRATVLAVPSRDDGMPTVILEAFASACPAVAYDVGAIGELVDETTGALIAQGDARAMAAALDELLGDATRRAAAAHAARTKAELRFAWPAVAAQTLEVLKGLRR